MGRRTWTSYQDVMVGQETKSGEPLCGGPIRPATITPGRDSSRSPMAGGWYLRPSSPEPQPLDLSSKPAKRPASPNKTIFKAKPRLSAVGGRRSYTEDELQAALRDIQSGKLGTRRAAVIYGIPRSTLRNKVYKISQESRDFAGLEERHDDDDDDDDRELSGAEEERETEQLLNRPFSVEDVIRLTTEVRAWPCLQQLLGGASTSAAEEQPLRVPSFKAPKNGEETIAPTVPKDQPLDFRREARNHISNNNNNNNNHLDEKKLSPAAGVIGHSNTGSSTGVSKAPQQGGKGTRPKRGKYRNYDRDSLVEAVRAVQRGEMSVHRAGSYYGVPHSTLEYKVKERHLMRPRKREPKVQPPAASIVQEDKRKEEEKRVLPPRTPQLTPPLTNGLKMPIVFDHGLAYRQAFPYWQSPFSIPLEFGRPELFAATSQPLVSRRLGGPQEDAPAPNTGAPLSRSAREMAESLLETPGENGSFLDGIIRSSLDTGLQNMEVGKVLLEKLCRGGQISSDKSPANESPPPSNVTSNRTPSPVSNNENSSSSNNNSNSNNC